MRRFLFFVLAAAAALIPAKKVDAAVQTQAVMGPSRFAITLDGQFAGWAQKAEGLDVTWLMPDYRAGDGGNQRWFFPANTKNNAAKLLFTDGLVPFDWTLIKSAIAGSTTQHTLGIALYDVTNHVLVQWTLSRATLGGISFSPLSKEKTQSATVTLVFYGDTLTNTTSAPATPTWPAPTGDFAPTGFAFDFANCGAACTSASQLTFTANPQVMLPVTDSVKTLTKSPALNGGLTISSKTGAHLLDLRYEGIGLANGPQVIAAPANVTFAPKITHVL